MAMISAIGNLLKIRGAVIGNVPFLFIRGKVHHWWRYSSMSATRTCELLFQILGRSGTVLSVDVHDVMKEDQALGQASQEATCVDVLVNAVSICFKISALWVLDFRLLFVMAQVGGAPEEGQGNPGARKKPIQLRSQRHLKTIVSWPP